jgi:hypothetical protein
MRGTQSVNFDNIAATTDPFPLTGGHYAVSSVATWGGGNVALDMLGPDGSTYIPAFTAMTANAYATVFLPPGQYRFTITTATAVYLNLCRIPYE